MTHAEIRGQLCTNSYYYIKKNKNNRKIKKIVNTTTERQIKTVPGEGTSLSIASLKMNL